MDMHSKPSSRDPHERSVREALAQLRGVARPASVVAGDYEGHEAHEAEHHFELPTIEPVGIVRPPDSPDW